MADPTDPKPPLLDRLLDRLIPPFPVVMSLALFAMTWWIMWVLSPPSGKDPGELFKLLAEGLVLTAFIGGAVGAIFTVSRDGQKKNEIIAAQAAAIAAQSTPPTVTPAPPPVPEIPATLDPQP